MFFDIGRFKDIQTAPARLQCEEYLEDEETFNDKDHHIGKVKYDALLLFLLPPGLC